MDDLQVYTSLDDVPLDEAIPADERDRPDDEKHGESIMRHLSSAVVKPKIFVIPFTHTIKRGTKGRDVVGVKRALWKGVGLNLPVRPTQTFGPIAVQELKLFQKKHGLVRDGELGPVTLKKLAPFFDAYSFYLYEGYAAGTNPVELKRRLFVAYALWAYNNRGSIHYVQRRPMSYLSDLHHLPVYEDCSEFYTKAAKFAGFSDPNGFGYNGFGYTGTLGAHGTHIASVSDTLPGDAILYGSPPAFEHVACCIGNGRVVSHGSEGGPYLLRADYRYIAGIRRYI
jgi:peptidoglycan hydrolase-like protein with peptidoglycan-binding domain